MQVWKRSDKKYICLRFLDSDELEQVSMYPVLTSECLDSERLSLDFKLSQFWKLLRSVSVNRSDFNIEVSEHKCGNTKSINFFQT